MLLHFSFSFFILSCKCMLFDLEMQVKVYFFAFLSIYINWHVVVLYMLEMSERHMMLVVDKHLLVKCLNWILTKKNSLFWFTNDKNSKRFSYLSIVLIVIVQTFQVWWIYSFPLESKQLVDCFSKNWNVNVWKF